MKSVRLTHDSLPSEYLFEWTDEPLEMAVTRYDADGAPCTFLMPKEQARSLWREMLNYGYIRSPAHSPKTRP